ncbi:unnamed protein product [Spirodela intermedia]|uniref:Uncharacterized protein n=1 Tax=Spirodela intermedia TaxID=51605 RepID=A0A7I8IR43_SPIIN|nr:unnamed protein product [Spirodela intermedia]CAA6660273.1 unnamed protein product [Spirodela intermedia]
MASLRSSLSLLLVVAFFHPTSSDDTVYDLVSFGANPDGQTDSAAPLLKAWLAACGSPAPATIRLPSGRFFLSRAAMNGPCNNRRVTIQMDGTFEAPSSYADSEDWISFDHVDGVSIIGGTIDGRGASLWDCKAKGLSCPRGSRVVAVSGILQLEEHLISGLTSLNSKLYHIVIDRCQNVLVQGVKISAPADSPNTDGVHVQGSADVTIVATGIGTGDDCISVGPGTSNLWIERVACGPGHGIMQNVTVKTAVFTGTQNGLRIKTWGRPSDGFNVENPIVITQSYCPNHKDAPDSGVKISQVTYSDIQGSSANPVAVDFSCSPTNPCSEIGLENIKLTYGNNAANASCKNADGSASGFVIPPSCL